MEDINKSAEVKQTSGKFDPILFLCEQSVITNNLLSQINSTLISLNTQIQTGVCSNQTSPIAKNTCSNVDNVLSKVTPISLLITTNNFDTPQSSDQPAVVSAANIPSEFTISQGCLENIKKTCASPKNVCLSVKNFIYKGRNYSYSHVL